MSAEKNRLYQTATNFLWKWLYLSASAQVTEFSTINVYCNLGLQMWKYKNNKLSRGEYERIILRMGSLSLMD